MTEQETASSPGPLNKCDVCHRVFARQEHLVRHVRSHTREKPFKCSICKKAFSRLDTLNRHYLSHEHDATESPAAVASRACKECALGRARCSRGDPCKRCFERNIECSYPAPRKRRVVSSSRTEAVKPPTEGPIIVPGLTQTASTSVSTLGEDTEWLDPAVNKNLPNPGIERFELGGTTSRWTEVQTSHAQATYDVNQLYDLESGGIFNEEPMGVLPMNWLSPQYDDSLDRDAQLAFLSYSNIDTGASGFPFLFNHMGIVQEHHDAGIPMVDQMPEPPQSTATASLEQQPFNTNDFEHHGSASGQSATRSTTSVLTEGKLYVDGPGARAPFKGLALERPSVIGAVTIADGTPDSPTSTTQITSIGNRTGSNLSDGEFVSSNAYNIMLYGIQTESQLQSLEVDMALFPSFVHVAAFARVYFKKFHPIFPFLRKDAFLSKNSAHWTLLLAVTAVGAKYTRSLEGPPFRNILFYLLQKIIGRWSPGFPSEGDRISFIPIITESRGDGLDLTTLQAAIINVLCMLHSGDETLARCAFAERHRLVDACNTMHLLSPAESTADLVEVPDDETCIQRWSKKQAQIRTGMMIWILDSIFAYQFCCKHLMQLVDANVPLPCREDIWESPTLDGIKSSESVTLLEALEILYMEKRLPPNLSEFSTTLLIHAIHRRTKEVIYQSQTELSSWTPSAKVHPREKSAVVGETWPPSTSILSKWRNTACDALDILHWRANSKAAMIGGCEHPTILHLHLARLVLLTPTDSMQELAAKSSSKICDAEYMKARSNVLQWAIRDHFKARLSIVHAGAIFWYIRRYSNDSFVEPFAIYIAALVVWAYSVSVQFVKRQDEPQLPQASDGERCQPQTSSQASRADRSSPTTPAAEELHPEPSFIHLDRPCDDEMVQTYVRLGDKMSGYMLRVGSICDSGAPNRILKEGIRLLVGESCEKSTSGLETQSPQVGGGKDEAPTTWGIERHFAYLLRCLIQATPKQG